MSSREVDEVEAAVDRRDDAVREATRQLSSSVVQLRDAIGDAAYITTVLSTLGELPTLAARLSNVIDKASHWLEMFGDEHAGGSAFGEGRSVEDILTDLKTSLAIASVQFKDAQQILYRPVSVAYTVISHKGDPAPGGAW